MRNTFDHTRTGSSAATRLPSQEEAIAKVCHEANRAYCAGIGDFSQVSWESAPDWQRNSAIDGVRNIATGVTTRAEQSHESWLAEKARTGWKYGPVKDAEKKEHPCFVPFSELPPEQQMKDRLFFAVARTLLAHAVPSATVAG